MSRSGFYAWCIRKPSQHSKENQVILHHIRRIHAQTKQRYGLIKCWKKLNEEGTVCGRDRVARLRREQNIYAKRRKRFVVTTRSKHHHWIAPNQLNRNFVTYQPNQVWVGDVTFIATRQGWLYLAGLIDLYSRKVVGWSMSNSNNGKLVQNCLMMAITHRQPKPGLIRSY